LIKSLIDLSSISEGDLVYDIGAGIGNITRALLDKGARVISIEKDAYLFRKLQQRFMNREAVSLHHADFLKWEFSGHRYKVFANIPFIQTADIVKKLIFNLYPPEDCYLIMQKEAALKYAGMPKETLASLLLKPVFWVDIVGYFSRKDFYPPPAVDIVLIQFEKRKCRLVPETLYDTYRDFIVYCRESPYRTVKQLLKSFFPYPGLKEITALAGFSLEDRPIDLFFLQYMCLFQFLVRNNTGKMGIFLGAEKRLAKKQAGLQKIHRTRL
jgi:23S rRNA (adenine-N6)-dimethyltransferase